MTTNADQQLLDEARESAQDSDSWLVQVRSGAVRPERDTIALLLATDDDWRADRQGVDWDKLSYEARRNYRWLADEIVERWP